MPEAMFIEIGTGVDLQGEDATKAAVRAVRDGIGRNYMPAMRRLMEGGKTMTVAVRLGVPAGVGAPDLETVRGALPYGKITVEFVPGGLLVPNGLEDGGRICIVVAALEVGAEG